ncbi:MAG: helix-turn-helix domain-containing protein [Sulfolobales archaeon]
MNTERDLFASLINSIDNMSDKENREITDSLDIGDLSESAFRIYFYLLTENEPRGVREIARDLGMPVSTVHYNLKRLERIGLVKRVSDGYVIARIIKIRGYIVIGRYLIPRFFIYSLFFVGVVSGYLIRFLILNESIDIDKIIAVITALVALVIFIHELRNIKNYRVG